MTAREALVEELERFPVVCAYLFGSQDEEETTPRSDVDVAVLLEEGLDPEQRRSIRDKLSLRAADVYGTEASDVVLLDDAPAPLAFQAIQGTVLVDRDPERRIRVEARMQGVYHDRRYYEERWEAETLRRFREEGFA